MKRNLFGTEWYIFLPDISHLPRPDGAIAWNHNKGTFELLTKGQITDHYNNRAPLTNTYTLYATISPYERDNTPLYIDSMLDWETHETLLDYLPNNFRSLFHFILATSLRNLKIINHLGGGQFASVWQVTCAEMISAKQATEPTAPVATRSSERRTGSCEPVLE